jgi:hypothetical protein
MILRPFRGGIALWAYPFLAVGLLLPQHLVVWWSAGPLRIFLLRDAGFWFAPVTKLTAFPYRPEAGGLVASAYLVAFASSCAVAALSVRRAARSGGGFGLALATIVPGVQLLAVLLLAVLPPLRPGSEAEEEDRAGTGRVHALQGLLAGVALIVLAVIVSAVTFGAYGYGLFLLTPMTVGLCTGYLANRGEDLGVRETNKLVLTATALGGVALVALALEGVVCLIFAAPLVIGFALMGGQLGRLMAGLRNARDKPLMAIALLPAVFALEAAVPPAAAIQTRETIDIAAPPSAVWRTLTSDAPIAIPAGLLGRAGLAYPVRGKLLGAGVGAVRIGVFSTGIARERVTDWRPGRRLAFQVLVQPPAMEEMSPYRRVHAPHVNGYFDTGETAFALRPLTGGGTRLTLSASHVLRIDPVPYWEPLARWAAAANSRRVLEDIKTKAERRS